jgi:hypothetical protein
MALARRLAGLGREARSGAASRGQHLLGRALIGAAGFAGLPGELRELVCAELGVGVLEPLVPGTGLPRHQWACAGAGDEAVALEVRSDPGGGGEAAESRAPA